VANIAAIVSVLRHYNPVAPVYLGWLENRRWTDARGGDVDVGELRAKKSVAFCGLGNPESFGDRSRIWE